jgi:hypothetical protein
MDQTKRPSITYAKVFSEAFPKLQETEQKVTQEHTQFITWIIGIASTLIAVAATDPARLKHLFPAWYVTFAFLVLAIACGVLYRILGLYVSRLRCDLDIWLYGFLLGTPAGAATYTPAKLSPCWTKEDIAQKLISEFEIDNTDLLDDPEYTLEDFRKSYQESYEIYQESENTLWNRVHQAINAYRGLSDEEITAQSKQSWDEKIQSNRLLGIRVRRGSTWNSRLFTAAGVFFIVAIGSIGVQIPFSNSIGKEQPVEVNSGAPTGDAGNDRLFGEAGNRVLIGGTGTDTCDGGAGTDTSVTCETRVSTGRVTVTAKTPKSFKREDWVLAQYPQNYTVQLFTNQNEFAMPYFRDRYEQSGDLAYYATQRGNTTSI